MAKTKKVYRVNTDDVIEMLAISKVVGDKDFVTSMTFAMEKLEIPIDQDKLKEKVKQYKELEKRLSANRK